MRGRRRDGAAAGSEAQGRPASAVPPCPICHFHRHSTLGSHTHIQRFHSSRARSQSVCREESAHPPYPPSRRWPPGGSHFVTSSMPPGRETLQSCNRANESDKGKLVWLPSLGLAAQEDPGRDAQPGDSISCVWPTSRRAARCNLSCSGAGGRKVEILTTRALNALARAHPGRG